MIKKISELLVSLFLLSLLSFLMMKLLPGSPFETEVTLSDELRLTLEKQWKLDQPVILQYFHYIQQVLSGNWGASLQNPSLGVLDQILAASQTTFSLGIFSLILIGTTVSCFFYLSKFEVVRQFIRAFNFVVLTMPTLFVGPLLIWLFAIYFEVLPLSFLESPSHYVLPVFILSLRPIAYLSEMLLLRESEEGHLDYLKTARAKGLSESEVRTRHLLPNLLIPIVAYLPTLVMGLLSGAFLVEIFFAIPGLGTEMIRALEFRDTYLLVLMTTVLGFFWILLSQITDLVLKALDPRIVGKLK